MENSNDDKHTPTQAQISKLHKYFEALGFGNTCYLCQRVGIITLLTPFSVIFRCRKCKKMWAAHTRKKTSEIIMEEILKD